jgi:hypothetical protein
LIGPFSCKWVLIWCVISYSYKHTALPYNLSSLKLFRS